MIENLIGAKQPEKIWENDFIEFFVHLGKDGSVWFHHNLKYVDRSVIKNTPSALEEFFVTLNTFMGVDEIYSYCQTDKILKWALYNGCEVVEKAIVDGKDVAVVRYK